MKDKKKSSSRVITFLFAIGAILVAIGAVIWLELKGIAGWLLASGGFLMALSFLINAFQQQEKESFRARRLERMQLLSSLIYIVSGGFMIQQSGTWLPLFIIATVFFVYSAFVKDSTAS